MLIENEFVVAADPDFLWRYLLDVERVAPCMPGAELTETIDDRHWKGKVNMKFGPISMSFAGTVSMEERDDATHSVQLVAKGMEAKGKGAANASVTSWLEPAADGKTTVKMKADITLTGAAAQMSRGLLPEISKRLTQQFADCLQESMGAGQAATTSADTATPGDAAAPAATPAPAAAAAPQPEPPLPTPQAAKPVGGIRLGLIAVWSIIAGFFKRLFGGGSKT